MSEETKPEQDVDTSKGIKLSVKDMVIIVGGIFGILTFCGQFFVTGDKVRSVEVKQAAYEAEAKERSDRLTIVEQWQKAADPVLVGIRSHIADRSLHTTPEDVNARIALQMQPFLVNMESVKGDIKALQKQNDRIEGMLTEVLAGKKPVSPPADANR